MKLKIKNISITVKETIKYLGVYLDTTLQWKEQISKTKTKITKIMPLLYKIKNALTEDLKKTIYHTIIESKLIYGIEIWGKATKTEMSRIQKTQNKIVRMLFKNYTNKDKNTDAIRREKEILNCFEHHIERLVRKGWESIQERKRSVDECRNEIRLEEKEIKEREHRNKENTKWLVKKSNNHWGEIISSKRIAKILNKVEMTSEYKKMKTKYESSKIKKELIKTENADWINKIWI